MSETTDERLAIGLMSGTSFDAVDAALVRATGTGLQMRIELLAHHEQPFPPPLRERIARASRGRPVPAAFISELNRDLGERFAEAALAVARKRDMPTERITVIGSHGQTISHGPGPGGHTFQIAEPAIIAMRTGVLTVGDFRQADLAVGGQGAPLVPFADWLLLRSDSISRAVQNIGGIANVTYLPAGAAIDKVVAFDTGPGNMVLDRAVSLLTEGAEVIDTDGRMARRGIADKSMLVQLMNHPFFSIAPPKTAGAENFGPQLTDKIVNDAVERGMRQADILATITEWTADSIAHAYGSYLPGTVDEVIVSGGGSRNLTLMTMLRKKLRNCMVRDIGEFGIQSKAKEALSFAVLALATLDGVPNSCPQATGADSAVVLGKICPSKHHPRPGGRLG
jgi:anhydro-N-acetylmuramic acid kinase